MDQMKIGSFLKELRKEKGITQEQLAEVLHVSGRTVSRWETGSNMPDISILIDIADYYDISIPEIINGERKSEIMNKEEKEIFWFSRCIPAPRKAASCIGEETFRFFRCFPEPNQL